MSEQSAEIARRRTRQRKTITALALLLIGAGLYVLFLLPRMPLPIRIMVGLVDVLAGLVLLVLVRQKFPPARPPGAG
jgi:uncharacterized membrane protein HdeD (DUF308 family)